MTSRGIDLPMSRLAHRAAEVVAAFHPPPSAFTSGTLASIRHRRIST
jgi:hypothetical protein